MSHSTLTHLLELTNDVVWTATLDGQHLLYANPALERVYGRPLADFYNDFRLVLELVHPADRELAVQSGRELLTHGQSEATYRIIRPDGTTRWLLDRKHVIYNDAGQPQCIGGIAADITAQKQTELALRESEERLREILENSLDVAYKRNLKADTYDYLSSVFTRISGYTPVEMKSFPIETVLSLLHPDDLVDIDQVLTASLVGTPGTIWQVDYRFKHKNGQYRWFHDQFVVVDDAQGQPVARIGSVSDITERKHLETGLRVSEERLGMIITGANLGTWDWEITTGQVTFNERWAEMLGYNLAEIEPNISTWENLLHPDDVPTVMAKLNEHLAGQTASYQTEHRLLAKSGEWKWFLDTGRVMQRDQRGNPLRAAGIQLDITDRKQAEQALRESERKFRSVVEKSPNAIILTDETGHLIEWNPAAERLFGLSHADALSRFLWDNLFQVMPAEQQTPDRYERLKAEWQSYFQTGQHPSLNQLVEVNIARPDGSLRQVESTRYSVPTERGFLLGVVIRDVTAGKQAEAERERLIGELQATLAQVKQLSGMLPICANCKQIRDDQGYWQDVAVYIRDHSEAEFSHGLCPDCAKKLYPEIYSRLHPEE